MLRIRILAIAAASMLSIAAAQAADLPIMPTKALPVFEPPPPLSGYLELYTGGAWNNESEPGGSENSRAWVLGGSGRVNYWWSQTISLQFDAQADGANYTGQSSGPSRFSAQSFLIGGHASWRNDAWLLGAFVGGGDASPDELAPGNVRHGIAGGEGQLYWNAFTFYGQGGYDGTIGSLNSGPGTIDNIHAWFLRGTARYYINPNLRLEGTVLYDTGAHDFTAGVAPVNFTEWLWRAKIEYKFDGSPFAVLAAYQGTNLAFAGESVFDHRVLAGMRIYFGDRTLRANDIAGATLDIIEPIALLTPSLN